MKKLRHIFLAAILTVGLLFPVADFTPLSDFSSSAVWAADDEEENDPGTPRLFVDWNSSVQEFRAGEARNLVIPIYNDGDGEASECYATLSVSNPNEFPFQLDGLKTTRALTNIKSKQTIWADFGAVQVSSAAKSQLYEITVSVEYKDPWGHLNQTSETVLIRIINEDNLPELAFTGIQLVSGDGTELDSGTTAAIRLCMQNEGTEAARKVEAVLSGFSQDGISLSQATDTFKVDEVEGKSTFFIPYSLKLHEDMLSGTYTLDLHLSWQDSMNNELTDDIKVYLVVNGKEEESKSKATPRLIISNYDFGGAHIKAGSAYSLQMIFSNTSAGEDIQNIKVSVSSDDNIMSPVGSSNTFVIPKIEKSGTLEHTIVLQPRVDADTKMYNVNVSMEYQDEDGAALSAQEVIGVPVVQEIRFTFSDMMLPTECYAGSPVDISVDYYNMGRAELRNMMITTEVQQPADIRNGEVYVGNVSAGQSDYYNVTVIPQESGSLQGVILFAFEDAVGNQYVEEKPFSLTVMEMPVYEEFPQDFPEMPVEEESGIDKRILIGAGVAAAAVAVFLFQRHRRRRKQEAIEIDE